MVRLIELQDADFNWLLDEDAPTRCGLRRPPGGVDAPATLNVIRQMTKRLSEAGCRDAWMIVAENEVVGLCSYKVPPENGEAEIGCGIAASRTTLGHATRAVEAMIEAARKDPVLTALVAETAVVNPSSERVLEKNGFIRVGERQDQGEGLVRLWRLVLPRVSLML